MAELCECEGGLSSLNRKRDCRDFLKKAIHIMPMQRKANGAKNNIDVSTVPVPESLFNTMFKASGAARLHIIYDIKNTAFETQDGATEDWADGTSSKLRDGHLQMTFVVPETDLSFIGNSADLECKNPDTYLYLADGSIIGYADRNTIGADQKLYPLPVDRWEVVETPLTTDDGVAKVEVTVHFSNEMSYKKWIVLKANQHDFDDSENYEAIDANLTAGVATLTSLQTTANLDGFGILGNSVPLTGLLPADFVVTVAGSPSPVLTAVESPNGTYLLTFTTAISLDEITATLAPASDYASNTVVTTAP